MDQKDRNDFFDELLDAGLARYAGEEPRPGLERRVLEKALARRRGERWGWTWALAAGTVTLALAGLFIVLSRRPSVRLPSVAQDARIKTAEPSAATEGRPYTAAPRLRRTTRGRTRPEQFPTPAPLTEQEYLLFVFVRTAPASVLATQEWWSNQERGLEIPKLTITALAPIKPLSDPSGE